jgi:hypothetical protein
MKAEELIRQIAKRTNSMNLFIAAKEINGICLFRNSIDFTRLQSLYLHYLYFYNDILIDIEMKEVDKVILSDFIYEDAYKEWKKESTPKKTNKSLDKKAPDLYLMCTSSKKKVA